MYTIDDLIKIAVERKASDLHITVGKAPCLREDGELRDIEGFSPLTPNDVNELIIPILPEQKKSILDEKGDTDFAYVAHNNRMRVNVYKQRGNYAMALRILARIIPTFDDLGLPPVLKNFCMLPRGLILVTGATGSGKSTTLAAMVDYINENRSQHIITIEDPIEYLHQHKKSMVNQREVSEDTIGFAPSLHAALREDPDIILVGEMRDLDTIRAAITAAETGHLVFSTLHTMGASNTIDRIIDVFPPAQQQQIRTQLSESLQGVISQQLLPLKGSAGRIAALEIMVCTDAISNLIREAKAHQIDNFIQTGKEHGMQAMDADLAKLVKTGKVEASVAQRKAVNIKEFKKYL
jgi:twitching motility protein PilT